MVAMSNFVSCLSFVVFAFDEGTDKAPVKIMFQVCQYKFDHFGFHLDSKIIIVGFYCIM
eukprot:06521.XXX_357045_357221_1 [CDS] Oithona nana genome sequencing.